MAKMSRRRVLVILIAAGLAVVAFGSGVGALVHYRVDASATCMNQGATLVTHQGAADQCVGVTDGSYRFDPADHALTAAEDAIRAADRRVTASGRGYVSVAYLLPISATGGVQPIHTAAEQLEGAFAAQHYANGHDLDGSAPKVQLLIASSGTQGTQWRTAAAYIEHDVASQHLVAVAGLGVSLSSTLAEVNALTRAGIPIIGSSITSDAFDNIKNLVRVSPSNLEEVTAALSFIKPDARSAFLIEDTNPSDSYDKTLVTEFRGGFPGEGHSIIAEESYDTTGDRAGDGQVATEVANRIGQMTSDICSAHADVVLFAGRGRDLATLLGDLADRPCLTQQVTIVTGDDVTDMPVTARVRAGLATKVSLYYAGNASPQEWSAGRGAAIKQGRAAFERFDAAFTGLFPGASLLDGNAMMGYDAMLTTISAIRLTAGQAPAPRSVAGELGALQGTRAVHGASGLIVLPANYQSSSKTGSPAGQPTGSNPVAKPVPMLRLEPNGTPEFVQLDWPDHHPPAF